jgi:Pvc16 N-terminal domain
VTDGYGIAAVTAVLRSRLGHRLAAPELSSATGTVTVSALPPDRIPVGSSEPTQLNLFLHQISPNAAWRNLGLPSVTGAGEPVDAPPLGLDLHYLMTAYSADQYVGEIVLGHALQVLQDEPVLTRDTIRAALDPTPPDPNLPDELALSGLAEQIELLKITPTTMTAEELSRLWSALQAHYRPTVCFQVTVLLLEGTRSRRPALPVRGTGSYAAVLDSPQLDTALADGPTGTALTVAGTLVLRGRRLRGPGASLLLGAIEVALTDDVLRDTEVRLPLSGLTPPPRAGVQAVQIRHELPMGDPPQPHQATLSNPLPILLAPTATATAGVASTGTVAGVPVSTGTVHVTVAPPVGRHQRADLLLNRLGAAADPLPRGASLTPPPDNGVPDGADETTTLAFGYTKLARGDYLLRLVVDGAESPLSPGGVGTYATPAVTL